MRSALVLLHRWAGLVVAFFLLVAGITGSLLAWNDELEAVISPTLFVVRPPSPDTAPIDPLILREQVQSANPNALVAMVPLAIQPESTAVFRLYALPNPMTGAISELPNDQVFVNPYTGRVLGERRWGDIAQGAKNLMPFIYRLHYSLALGEVGSYAFGIAALLWTLDCFVGACLTFPVPLRTTSPQRVGEVKPSRSWILRWWRSWLVRWKGGSYKLNFDLHRAGGLWVWAMLFMLAWSGVAFNLSKVYDPVMKTTFAYQPDQAALHKLDQPRWEPVINWFEARNRGRQLMAAQAAEKGFRVLSEDGLIHDPLMGTYSYSVRSERDIADHLGSTRVTFDADTGAFKEIWLPTGAASGDTIRTWITGLHMAALGGLLMKVFVCVMGLVVAMLSVTGTIIWARKRSARRKSALRKAIVRPGASNAALVQEQVA